MIDVTDTTSRRRWFSDGASLRFSPRLCTIYWIINLGLFVFLNMFDLRLRQGMWIHIEGPYTSEPLIPGLLSPLSIFHYPWQILVKGALMALLCVVPVLTALLYNLLYALPFIAIVFFVGLNPVLSLCLFFSSAAVSFEPLRFKSKFVAVVLCLLPELFFWWFFSGENSETDILRWAVLYAPWALAFFLALAIAGLVIGIGHFLQYRPGILMPIFGLFLAGTILLFHYTVGMNERDYQAQVFQHSPYQAPEFQMQSILPLLEEELARQKKQTPYIPDEQILKLLRMNWGWTFIGGSAINMGMEPVPTGAEGQFSLARRKAIEILNAFFVARDQYIESFIQTHKRHRRLADALYFKALYTDMHTDQRRLRDEDMLSFYFDVPGVSSEPIWREILERFPESDVSIEARWRLARLYAAQKPGAAVDSFQFDQALVLLQEAEQRCKRKIEQIRTPASSTLLRYLGLEAVFTPPLPTISPEQWLNLQFRIYKLKSLISPENRTGHIRHEERLVDFVALDPHQLSYPTQLKNLLLDSPQPDPLIDNIELAEVLLLPDSEERIVRLHDLVLQYKDRDGGIEASLQLALEMLQQMNDAKHPTDRQTLLIRAREQLQEVIQSRPESFWADYARTLRSNNPLE